MNLEEKNNLRNSLLLPIVFVLILWLVKVAETVGGFDWSNFGVYPRAFGGLLGILTAPFLHGDWEHLFSNSVPLIVLGFLLIQSYRSIAMSVVLFIYIMSGIGMWLMGRPSHHIGASGIVYGLAFFLFVSGVLRRDRRSMALASIVVIFYGGMVWGMLPGLRGISWEGHIAGAVAGIAMAYRFRKIDLPKRYDWEFEPNYYDEGEIWEEPFWVLPEPEIMGDVAEIPITQANDNLENNEIVENNYSSQAQSPPIEQLPLEIRYYFKPKDKYG